MRIIFLLIALGLFSCSSQKDEPIIVPPNFAQLPDPKNPEKPLDSELKQQQEKDVARLKELLLQSD